MSGLIESRIRFDFSLAPWHEKHDAINTVWPAVDFRIEEPDQWIWLEVKNWEPSTLPARHRGGQRRSFLAKLKSSTFYEQLRSKFLGTSSYLLHTGQVPDKYVSYVILLESPKLDPALKLHANQRMTQQIRPRIAWNNGIGVAVVDLSDWNERFGMYSATRI